MTYMPDAEEMTLAGQLSLAGTTVGLIRFRLGHTTRHGLPSPSSVVGLAFIVRFFSSISGDLDIKPLLGRSIQFWIRTLLVDI